MAKNLYENTLLIETKLLQLKGEMAMFERMIELGWKESDVTKAFKDVFGTCIDILGEIRALREKALDKFNTYHVEQDVIAQYGA